MKLLLLSIQIILISSIGYSQPGNEILTGAIMTFETEIIDYGTINQGSNGVREFKFTNTGNEPLIISEAKKTCGCTIPTWPKEPIKPGGSGIIKVKYDTKRLGAISKSVIIISNAQRKSINLQIRGKIMAAKTSPIKKVESQPIAQ